MPDAKKGSPVKSGCKDESPIKNSSWMKMLAKVCEIEVSKCQHCKGEMSIVAAIIKRSEVARYLKHLGIEHEPPARAPPKYQQVFLSSAPQKIYWKACPPLMADIYG